MNTKILKSYLATVGFLAFGGLTAQAGSISLGVPDSVITGPVSETGFVVQYSINSNPGTYALANDSDTFDASALPENTTVSGQTFRLELTNIANVGASLSLLPLNNAVGLSLLSTSPLSAGHPFNGLSFRGVAWGTQFHLDYSNISFTTADPLITINGSFASASLGGIAFPGDQRESFLAYMNDNGSPGDLSTIGWTFGADVTLTGIGSPESGWAGVIIQPAVFNYTASASGSPAAVPETSTWVMGLLALGAVVFLIRRKNATNL